MIKPIFSFLLDKEFSTVDMLFFLCTVDVLRMLPRDGFIFTAPSSVVLIFVLKEFTEVILLSLHRELYGDTPHDETEGNP